MLEDTINKFKRNISKINEQKMKKYILEFSPMLYQVFQIKVF
jgi:hypothetical protein